MIKSLTKKLFVFFLIITLFLISIPQETKAEEFNNIRENEIIFFGSPTCPHCKSEKQFLENLKESYSNITINEYDFSSNIKLVNKFYEEYNVPKNQQGLVPVTFINNQYFVGFNDNIKQQIENQINSGTDKPSENKKIRSIFGKEVNIDNFSLPILSMILGIVDGFNVCSLGALVIILGLVMALGSKKRILFLGGTFLIITGITYGLLIFLWHQLFSLITPYVKSMELLIGILSIIGGIYLIKEFIKSYRQGPNCSSNNLLGRLSPKVEKVFSNKRNIIILISVVALFSLVITIVEFPCSAFLPVIFSGILAEAHLSWELTLLYMSIYIIFYLLDEIIIFLIALFTMKIKILSPKFINFFTLLAALIFLFLGSYYIYRIF